MDEYSPCHAVCKAWRNLILRPSSSGGEFGATLWRGHLLRVVHANADLLAGAYTRPRSAQRKRFVWDRWCV